MRLADAGVARNPGSCTGIDTRPPMRTARTWVVSAGESPECTTALVTSLLATIAGRAQVADLAQGGRAIAGASRPYPTYNTKRSRSEPHARRRRQRKVELGLQHPNTGAAFLKRIALHSHHRFQLIQYGSVVRSSAAILRLPPRPRTSKAALRTPDTTAGPIRWSSA